MSFGVSPDETVKWITVGAAKGQHLLLPEDGEVLLAPHLGLDSCWRFD